ncbi:GspH/FimT family pseudopilin [Litchfieldella rifensis]|uniref:Type II secretion system protein H n=1 Tax=Litchfieldella rifensis TaxID=762643 RepID=A0ABV7LPA0_9GAMM
MAAGSARRVTGFTLIELLVTLAVAFILATVAMPGLQRLIVSNRLASDYNEILAGLHYARSEAVKRREAVQAVLAQGEGGAWQLTVSVVDGPELRVRTARDDDISTGAIEVTFNSLGRRAACAPDTCDVSIGGKEILVGPSGRIGKPFDA